MPTLILSVIVSFLLSFVLTPLVRNFFISRGWVEDPVLKQQKTGNATATKTVPRGGGIAVFVSLVLTTLFFSPLNHQLIFIFIAALFNLIIGIWDDIKDISPKIRLVTNFLSALIIVASGVSITFLTNPFGGIIEFSSYQIISVVLTIFWIIWCMNITGWSAGIEGQLPGYVAVSAFIIGILGLRFVNDPNQLPLIILSGALSGAYLGFLPFNFYHQSIQPGYSGKSLAGFMLAVLSLLSGAKLATLFILLGIPMLDAIFAIIRRLINHQPIYLGDNFHLHHQLLKNGWSRPQIAVFYWSVTLIFGLISLFLNSQQKIYAIIALVLLFVGFILKYYRRI
ncbi:MAG TPA: MraY family glycosyltransferase [Candidatus Woesebacteria bacterium]|nr:MraY family glycosyltransferase [Candidatus Woesebacteria bacterium]